MIDIIKDVATLSSVKKETLTALVEKVELSIIDALVEGMLQDSKLTTLDIGIGELLIEVDDDVVRYQFRPSAKLDAGVRQSITEKKSPLERKVDKAIGTRLNKIYKDLF